MEQPYISYLPDAIDAALQAGNDILSIYENPLSDFHIEMKADHSPLTVADQKAHATIHSRLCSTPFPILSEEGKAIPFADRSQWHTFWMVDPLDGTKEFIKRNGEFTVNIALIHEGIPVLGVIYVPVKRDLYFASEGTGAYKLEGISQRGTQPVTQLISSATSLPIHEMRDTYVAVASRSHLTPETEAYINDLRQRHGNLQLVSAGSSLKICLVAEGKADVYPRFAPTMEWDTAAGHAIARMAGMEIYQAEKGIPLEYNKENLLNPWFIVEPKHGHIPSNP